MKIAVLSTTFVIALLTGVGGFKIGQWQQELAQRPIEIKQGCAYYDMTTGNFTWGAKPITLAPELDSQPTKKGVLNAR